MPILVMNRGGPKAPSVPGGRGQRGLLWWGPKAPPQLPHSPLKNENPFKGILVEY